MGRRRKKAKKLVTVKVDRLSALPDEMLHKIMEHAGMKAWEVVRTCILSRRWLDLWASAPCVDLRVFCIDPLGHSPPPENFSEFVDHFLSKREKAAPLDTLRLIHVPTECEHWFDDGYGVDDEDHEQPTYDSSDVARWVTAAMQRRARVIDVTHHPEHRAWFEMDHVSVTSSRLQQLKLWYARLGAQTLEGISSECPSLQVLELKECILDGSSSNNLSSESLKSLCIENCRIWVDLSVTAPNLVSLRCVKPYDRAPFFCAMGSLATATIILVDSFLTTTNYYVCEECADYPLSLSYSGDDASYRYDDAYGSDTDSISTCQYGELADDSGDEQSSAHGADYPSKNGKNSRLGGHHIHGPTVFGGDKLLLSLSNATSLDLIADLGEVILNRELKTCPTFSNLKTLFLGEWCMADDFGPLVSFLDHCPNLERLSIELRSGNVKALAMSDNNRPLSGGLLACQHLTKLKIIKCCKDDVRVNALVKLFVDSGMDIQKICVRQTRNNCLLTSSTEVAL